MEMTTPVFTTAGQGQSGTMEFPIEEKMGEEPGDLPIPDNARLGLLPMRHPYLGITHNIFNDTYLR